MVQCCGLHVFAHKSKIFPNCSNSLYLVNHRNLLK
uniref:Uncharacterized protein n=1 Tax=Ascaris lumbricoides TaxID=6252 RepID=A0A0M3I1R8_ASCLU